uniref:Uncharacterized protein LOC104229395 n=1 Tax=Nicotiana sylvestris TaxID=4096 RepID=A0A1U7WSQ6_NICSY
MENDCFSYVLKCHHCQIHGDLIHAPPSELHPMSEPRHSSPEVWMSLGQSSRKLQMGTNSSRLPLIISQSRVEAVTFKAFTKKAVVDFVHSNIICRFGIPITIITYNATNLNSHLMRA